MKRTNHDPLLEKLPPHDLDAEEAILSAIFIDNTVLLDMAEKLSADDFYKMSHQKIYSAIMDLFSKDEPADLVTVAAKLRDKGDLESIGGPAYLASIADSAPMAINAIHYADILRGKAMLRRMITSASSIIERCLLNRGNVQDVIDFAESTVFKIAENQHGDDVSNINDLIHQSIDTLETRQKEGGSLLGLTTGYSRLDGLTSGLQKSDLIILAARPSMGKTALALNIARNVATKESHPIVFFSLEMSKAQLAMRLLTSEARIDSTRLKKGFIRPEDLNNVSRAAAALQPLPIYIDDTPAISIMGIRAKARRLKKDKGLGLIIIDYLQLIKAPARADRRDLEIAEISRALKGLAKELEVPVLALSQLNRMLEQRSEKRPILSDLRESGTLEQDADIVAFIYRDEVYNREEHNPNRGKAEIIVAKNRNGATGTAFMAFQSTYTRFEELAPETYNTGKYA